MATPVSIAIRRADALARVAKATRKIAKATGAEIADFPDPHKQEAMRPAIEAEWLADALEAIAQATASDAPQPEPEPDDEPKTQPVTPESDSDAPEAPPDDAAPKSDVEDEDGPYKDEVRTAAVETVKTKAKRR